MGVNHSVQGTETVTLLNTLAVLTGNIGGPGRRRSRSPGSATRWAPARPASRRRCPATAPTTTPAPGPSWPRCWGVDEDRLPAERGRAYPDIINAVRRPARSRACGSSAPTRSVSFPNREMLELALRAPRPARRAGRLRDADHRARRRRAARRDLGREGRHVHQQRAAGVAGAGRGGAAGRGPDRLRHLPGRRRPLGLRDELFPGWRGPHDAFEEWRRVSAGRPCDYSGITWERIDAAGGVQWPCPAGDADVPPGGHAAPVRRPALQPPRRAGPMVLAVEPEPIRDAAPARLPASCSTPAAPSSTGTPARRRAASPILEGLAPEAWVEVHPADAAALGVALGRLGPGHARPGARSSGSGPG